MSPALLPLFVVLPLAASALAALLPAHRYAAQRTLLLGAPTLTALGGAWLVHVHATTPVLATRIGGFPAGVAIPLVSDTLTAVMLAVTGVATLGCLLFAGVTGEDRLRFFPALALMLSAGVNGALLTGDLFNLFVFVEVMLLPSYALLATTGTWRRLAVGRLFLVVNLVTSSIFLIGIGLLYAAAGTVNLASLAGRAAGDPRVALGAAVVLLALVIKAGAVPVHGWLPRAYPATSAAVMALFSGLHTKVAIYAVHRVYAVVFAGSHRWLPVLLALALASMLLGSWSSSGENTIRRILAFQMVGGLGYVLLGVALSTEAALAGGLVYLVHSILTIGSLILASGAIEDTYGTGHLVRLAHLIRRERGLSWITALGLLSLVGFPPSSGFFAKVSLVLASAAEQPIVAWPTITVIVLSSVLGLLALQRLWVDVFWGKPMETYRPADPTKQRGGPGTPVPLPASVRIGARRLLPAAILLGLALATFVLAGPVFTVAERAAHGLVDTAPYVGAVLR